MRDFATDAERHAYRKGVEDARAATFGTICYSGRVTPGSSDGFCGHASCGAKWEAVKAIDAIVLPAPRAPSPASEPPARTCETCGKSDDGCADGWTITSDDIDLCPPCAEAFRKESEPPAPEGEAVAWKIRGGEIVALPRPAFAALVASRDRLKALLVESGIALRRAVQFHGVHTDSLLARIDEEMNK